MLQASLPLLDKHALFYMESEIYTDTSSSVGLELGVFLEQVPAIALGGLSSSLGVARRLGAVLWVEKLTGAAVFPPRAGAKALEDGLAHSVEEASLLLRFALRLWLRLSLHPFGSMLKKRSLRGLSDLLALHASKAELEQIIALTLSRPAFLNKTRIDDDASVCIFPTHFEHEHAYLTEASPLGTGVYKIVDHISTD